MDAVVMIYANLYADGHQANSLFAAEDTVHRHNPTYTPRLLRQRFLERGIEINTPDMNEGKEVAFDIHLEGRPLGPAQKRRYLIALENPNINKLNACADYCSQFDLAFVWDSRLYSLPNVVHILIPYPMQWEDFKGSEQRDIFSCLINANKAFKETLPTDLYLERLKTIRWYEKNAPDQFHLYGLGWEKSTPAFNFFGRVTRSLERLKTRFFKIPPFPSYRGELIDKGSVLRRSRFSYCYENSRDLTNYITEKVFDSLVHGCVPVYWGADNVLDYLPEGCFVDKRKFKSTAEVHHHLMSISDSDYDNYQSQIRKFLTSNVARQFSSENVVNTIVDAVCLDLSAQTSGKL